MKNTAKIAIGATLLAATATFVAGVIHELKVIKKMTTDADDAAPEEILSEDAVPGADEEPAVEVVADAE